MQLREYLQPSRIKSAQRLTMSDSSASNPSEAEVFS